MALNRAFDCMRCMVYVCIATELCMGADGLCNMPHQHVSYYSFSRFVYECLRYKSCSNG